MAAKTGEMTPSQAFGISVAIFIAAVIAVVLLWALVDAWLAVIALAVAFFGVWGLLKRLSGN